MCTQKPPHDYSEQLYNRYRDAFSYYITEKVRLFQEVNGSLRSFLLEDDGVEFLEDDVV
jgi:hypothetical protein